MNFLKKMLTVVIAGIFNTIEINALSTSALQDVFDGKKDLYAIYPAPECCQMEARKYNDWAKLNG